MCLDFLSQVHEIYQDLVGKTEATLGLSNREDLTQALGCIGVGSLYKR